MDDKIVPLRPELEDSVERLLPKALLKALTTFQRLADKMDIPFVLVASDEFGAPTMWRSGSAGHLWCIAMLEGAKHSFLDSLTYEGIAEECDDEGEME